MPRDGWDAGKLQSAGWKNSKVCKTNPVFEKGHSFYPVEGPADLRKTLIAIKLRF